MSLKWCWIALAPALACAQPLPSLVEEALRNNREILAAQKRYEAARQRPAQAAALPDPSLSLGYTSNGGPYPVAGIGRDVTSNAGIMVSQELPAPGKRQLRGAIAAEEAQAELQDYLALRLNVVSRLTQAYHQLHHAAVAVDFVRRYQELLRNMMSIAEARYAVGRAAQQDILKAQTQYSIFETQLLRFQQERSAQEIAIAALLDRPTAVHIDVADEAEAGDLPASLDQMLAYAHAHAPLLAREQKIVEREDLAARLSRKNALPDYTLSAGYFNQGSMPPMWQVRVDFKLPAWFSKQRAEIAETAFAAAASRHSYESGRLSLDASIRSEYGRAETSRRLIDLYRKSAIPEAQLALESSMASYQTGSLDFLSLFSNFMSVVDYELMYHEEIMNFHVSLARLAEMTAMEVQP